MSQIPNAISVVIPTYNRAHLIKQSLQSVLDQTLKPYEIIVVDDFSTDNTEEVIKSLNSPLIKYVKNQRKKGANGARNTGILMAKGEYIAFHDSDDIWLLNKLKLQYDFMRSNKNIDLCFCSMSRNICNKIVVIPDFYIRDVKKELLLRSIISTQTMFLRNQSPGSYLFSEDIKRFQDWDFCLSLLDRISFKHIPIVMVNQNIQPDSISGENNMIDAYKIILNKHKNIVRSNNFYHYLMVNESRGYLDTFFRITLKVLIKLRGCFK